MHNAKIVLVVIFVMLVSGFFYFFLTEEESESIKEEIIYCLKEKGVIIYGFASCSGCAQLVESFGGYEKVKPIYVQCEEEEERCELERLTEYVPEIQIEGSLYKGPQRLEDIAKKVNCEF